MCSILLEDLSLVLSMRVRWLTTLETHICACACMRTLGEGVKNDKNMGLRPGMTAHTFNSKT